MAQWQSSRVPKKALTDAELMDKMKTAEQRTQKLKSDGSLVKSTNQPLALNAADTLQSSEARSVRLAVHLNEAMSPFSAASPEQRRVSEDQQLMDRMKSSQRQSTCMSENNN